ncbi:MAG TPA: class I SAM-dependent methyltransferase [Candidatus Saccharimonadales bacterium]|nr:class I SAM-dependent methyltransferase [Candidatus Saccharimonadales bacterium]
MAARPKIRLNLGCGINLVGGFINVDKYYSLEQLQSKKGIYSNATIEPGAEYVQADVTALPFKSDSVDYIESIDMIEHLPFRDLQPAFSEMARVLKPGGKLAILTNDFDNMATLWLENMTNGKASAEAYHELSELIYGNQLAPGEFHCNPINSSVLSSFIVSVGLHIDNLTIYRGGTNKSPKMLTAKPIKGEFLRSDMIWAQAHK